MEWEAEVLTTVKKALAFFAHTDDEMICAGTLHRLARQGCEVHVHTFGPAAVAEDRKGSHVSLGVVTAEWMQALDLIGVALEHRKLYNFVPSSSLETVYAQEIGDAIFNVCETVRPDAVFTLSPDDENTAHAVVGRQSERVLRGRVPLAIRCNYPWNFSIGRPNLFVSLSEEDLKVKDAVICCYKSQFPKPTEAGGTFRYNYHEMLMSAVRVDGQSVKVEAAEKFEVLRMVV